jgi:hypothetical protein
MVTLKATPTRSQGIAQESHSSHGEENMDVKARVSRKREGETEMAGRSLFFDRRSGLIRFLEKS